MKFTHRIQHWRDHQHYADRDPPWIKLYVNLLENPEWHHLSGDEAKLLIEIWLITTRFETYEGYIPCADTVIYNLKRSVKKFEKAWDKLIEHGWIVELTPDEIEASKTAVSDWKETQKKRKR